MKVNMDHMRRQMTGALNRLGEELANQLPYMDHCSSDVITAFNDLASYVGGLNCLSSDTDDTFNDMSEKLETMELSDEQ